MIYTITLNPARDRTVLISDFAAGKVNRIKEYRDDPGGKGINVSKVIKSLGGESVAMGILGGATGRYIEKCLNEMEITHDFVFTRSETRTNIKVYDDVNCVTTDINEAGAPVSKGTLSKVLKKITDKARKGDFVVFAGKIPSGANSNLLSGWIGILNGLGIYSVLDADSKTLFEGVKSAPFLIKPNEIELGELVGKTLTENEEILSAAEKVIKETGVRIAAVSMGERGAMFVKEDEAYFAKGLKIHAMSTVGAGDAMTAAMTYGLDRKMDFIDACRLSVASSAAAVMMPGTQSADRETVYALYDKVEITKIK